MSIRRVRQHTRKVRLRSGRVVVVNIGEHGRRTEGGTPHRLSTLPTLPEWMWDRRNRMEEEIERQGARDQGVYEAYIPPEDWAATTYAETQQRVLFLLKRHKYEPPIDAVTT